MTARDEVTPIIPSLSYADAQAAIEWLERALGFRRRLVVPGPDGTVRHSELSFGRAVVMVSSSRPAEGRCSPRELGGLTQTVSLHVPDPDAAHERAVATGAEVVDELTDSELGWRGFQVRDPEGHLWFLSDYVPGAHWRDDG